MWLSESRGKNSKDEVKTAVERKEVLRTRDVWKLAKNKKEKV